MTTPKRAPAAPPTDLERLRQRPNATDLDALRASIRPHLPGTGAPTTTTSGATRRAVPDTPRMRPTSPPRAGRARDFAARRRG
jgi:hypothetical protein